MKERFEFNYDLLSNWKELPIEEHVLVEQAYAAMENAYAPYSEFKVGACALMDDGSFVLGNNQENAAFPSGICAERVALFYAGANFPNKKVITLCIVAKGDLMPASQLLSPCGSCRQVMLESENRQKQPIRVLLVNQDGRTMILDSVIQLLPFGFGRIFD
jgi:cytidine deaminase